MPPRVRPANAADAPWIAGFLRRRWGDTRIAVHGELIEAAGLPALIAEGRRGLATYRRLGTEAEIVTLDADPAGLGTGSALIETLVARLRCEDCTRLWLGTTNDKLSALAFYLRRGFRLMQVRLGAAVAARKLKPSIPLFGESGIPRRDELDLCRVLNAGKTCDAPSCPPCPPPGKHSRGKHSRGNRPADSPRPREQSCRRLEARGERSVGPQEEAPSSVRPRFTSEPGFNIGRIAAQLRFDDYAVTAG
jgi:GNAT superfamily N-acetyltransferase